MLNIELLIETCILCLIAATSPGPNFLMTVSNSIKYGKSAGIMTAVGVTLGVSVWLGVCAFGLSFVITKNLWLGRMLNICAGCFLAYIGLKILFSKDDSAKTINSGNGDSSTGHFRHGFVGTILNGGVGVFYGAIFAKIIAEYSTNYSYTTLHILIFNIIEFVWYIFVAYCASFSGKFIAKYSKLINTSLSAGLLYFAGRIFYTL